MVWYLPVAAGLCEIVWAIGGIRVDPGRYRFAAWTGIGAAGTAGCAMILCGESRAASHLACIMLTVAGIIGLKVFSEDDPA